MRMAFTEVDGNPTRYCYAGEGFPVLFVHGAGVSCDNWMLNLDELGRDFRVVAPDILGHGFTGLGRFRGGAPQPFMVDHIASLVDQLNWERFAIMGSSFGAALALLTYFRLPDRVTKLILLSSASSTLSEDELARSLEAAFANGSSAINDPSFETCRRRMQRIMHGKEPPAALIHMQMNIYSRPGVADAYRLFMQGLLDRTAVRPYRVADRFAEVEIPTLMVWGRNDPRVIHERAVQAAQQMTEAYLVSLDDCGHEPHLEHPERFNSVVRQFLKGTLSTDYRVQGT